MPQSEVNTLTSWSTQEGYLVKYAEPCCLPIFGNPVKWPSTIHLNAGVNYIPVHSLTSIKLSELFGADTSKIILLIDIYTLQVYNPGFGHFNTLKYLAPGIGYIAFLSQSIDIAYPKTATLVSQQILNENREPYLFTNGTLWNNLVNTRSMHIISIEKSALSNVNSGDYIGAFLSNGICVGMAEYKGGDRMILTVFGDDKYTIEKEGMDNDEKINFKLYRNYSGEVINLSATYDLNAPEHDGLFLNYGFSRIISLTQPLTSFGNISTEKIVIFPNPSSDLFTIRSKNAFDNISLVNLYGQTIFRDHTANSGEYILDATQYPKGIYFIAVKSINGNVTNHRIVIQ